MYAAALQVVGHVMEPKHAPVLGICVRDRIGDEDGSAGLRDGRRGEPAVADVRAREAAYGDGGIVRVSIVSRTSKSRCV